MIRGYALGAMKSTAVTERPVDPGPRCQHCPRDEATCARLAGCCTACTHWNDYDARGNPRDQRGRHHSPKPRRRTLAAVR